MPHRPLADGEPGRAGTLVSPESWLLSPDHGASLRTHPTLFGMVRLRCARHTRRICLPWLGRRGRRPAPSRGGGRRTPPLRHLAGFRPQPKLRLPVPHSENGGPIRLESSYSAHRRGGSAIGAADRQLPRLRSTRGRANLLSADTVRKVPPQRRRAGRSPASARLHRAKALALRPVPPHDKRAPTRPFPGPLIRPSSENEQPRTCVRGRSASRFYTDGPAAPKRRSGIANRQLKRASDVETSLWANSSWECQVKA
jgi:hypothetical protein